MTPRCLLALALGLALHGSACRELPAAQHTHGYYQLPTITLEYRGQALSFQHAEAHSLDNENQHYLWQFWLEPCGLEGVSPHDFALIHDAQRSACTGIGTSPGELRVSFRLDRATSRAIAPSLVLILAERKHRGHELHAQLELAPGPLSLPHVRLAFVVENRGQVPIRFVDGDRTRNELGRDNRLNFLVVHEGQTLDSRELFDLGGLATTRRLLPGEKHTFEVDLEHWVTLASPGHYQIRATYEMELYTGAVALQENPRELPPENCWDEVLQAELELEIPPFDESR